MLRIVIAAASFVLFQPPQPYPDAPHFVTSCLQTDRFAADVSALSQLRASLSDADWSRACTEALTANGVRQNLIHDLFASPTHPVAGYQSAASFLVLAEAANDPAVAELFSRTARDQALRSSLPDYAPPYSASLSPAGKALLEALVAADVVASDLDNREWLRREVPRHGWFTITRDGPQADHAAWLMVQHADSDRDFQRQMIDVLEPLVDKHETFGPRFASLYDRWAEGANQPQRFGLGGTCTGPGKWKPRLMEDPSGVDRRRAAIGLDQTEKQFAAERGADCQ
jgi:hypothetical protein